jgi:hypothetical protein
MGAEGEAAITGFQQGTMRCLPRCGGTFQPTCVVEDRERVSCVDCADDPNNTWCDTNLGVRR